ncbi:2-phospho-L-lactate guanylyltransferase [Halioglobus japonicus]|nr:2-phospho-L-lactate guanylyltransferase [Halioglobus japonicus]
MCADKYADPGAASNPAARKDLVLIQFSRAPEPGHVKTRMQPHLSAQQACDLHCDLTRWTCRRLLDSALGDVELAVAGDRQHALFSECTAMGVNRLLRQRGDDLGQRMHHAIRCALARYKNVILVGSDCPGIDAAYLRQAVTALRDAALVLGPAHDGGYVLLGARVIEEEMFQGINWGSEAVLEQTAAILSRRGIRWEQLPFKADIDRPEDLPIWEALQRDSHTTPA